MSKNQERFSRQVLAFGKEGQDKIASARVAIVGLGGMGSCIGQMLAYLGVGEILLIDDDAVEESNLNRLIGAVSKDAKNRTPKVDVASRLIRSVNPAAKVEKMVANLRSEKAIDALCGAPDVVFGCVDNDSSRLILTELCAAYEKVFIDSAAEIIEEEGFREFGGRVVVARPGDYCLLCARQIDVEAARQELESDKERSFRRMHGYGLGEAAAAPAVISLNATISSLAVTECVMLLTGLRAPERMLTYKGRRGIVTVTNDVKKDGCIICDGFAGKRDRADVKRYLRSGPPKDLPR